MKSNPNMAVLTLLIAFSFGACVKKSVYKTEVNARLQSESREKVLSAELTDRKKEAEKMVTTIGELNRNIGRQESDIVEFRARIVQLSANASQTSMALLDEKDKLQKNLSDTKSELEKSKAELARINGIVQERDQTAAALLADLSPAYENKSGVTLTKKGGVVTLILPDPIFESAGLNISSDGKTLLQPLAAILNKYPSAEVSLISYTDNQLPKGNKTLSDTWEWSLRRAVQVTRYLITDLGVTANQLSPVGRGEYFPVAGNDTPEGRAQNRRTEVVIEPVTKEVR